MIYLVSSWLFVVMFTVYILFKMNRPLLIKIMDLESKITSQVEIEQQNKQSALIIKEFNVAIGNLLLRIKSLEKRLEFEQNYCDMMNRNKNR